MLQTLRDRIQGIVAAVIILLLCLTFAVWGIESYLSAARRVVVAKVNGDKIELAEYQSTFQRLRQRAQAELGDAFDADVWSAESTKLTALDYVVEEKLLQQTIDEARLRVSPTQVAEYLKASPNFQVDGKFSKERYSQVTSMLGFTERGFEEQARQDLALQQLRAGLAASAFQTPEELAHIDQLKAQTRDISYTLIQQPETATQTVTDEEVTKYFGEHSERYRIEDKATLEYVELKLEDLMAVAEVSDADLQQYYDAHTAEYSKEEQRSANHVLVQVKPDASPEVVEKARARALELRKLIVDGKPIEEVAKEHSDDIGSKAEGGATGLFGKGVMVPEFEAAVFGMRTGDLSEPIKTEFGFHIIQLKEVSPGGITPLAEVRAEVEAHVRREKAHEIFYENAERFSDTVYEHPDSLEAVADELNIKLQTTSGMSKTEIGAMFSPAVADAAWEPEVLSQGLASEPLEIGDERIVAVRVTTFTPTKLPTLEEVKTTVTDDLKTERAKQVARTKGEALVAKLKAGGTGQTLAAAENLTWETFAAAKRDDERVNRAVLRAAFSAPLAQPSDKTHLGVEFGSGNYAVIEVSNVQTPAAQESAAGGAKNELARVGALLAWQDFIEAIKASAKLETYPKNL